MFFELIINIALPLALVILAMITGSILEARHFRSIAEREQHYGSIAMLSGKDWPRDKPVVQAQMVQGATVVSVDYFKRLLASLRLIFGGELRSYASLLDRARRESILRMKAQCPEADLIINVRIETSSISKGQGKALGSTEVIAYGTALRFAA